MEPGLLPMQGKRLLFLVNVLLTQPKISSEGKLWEPFCDLFECRYKLPLQGYQDIPFLGDSMPKTSDPRASK